MKEKTCKFCKQKFAPERQKQICCSTDCAVYYSEKTRAKAERIAGLEDRKVIKAKLENLKPLSYWADKAQKAVNAYIRERDKDEPCISCGRFHGGKWNAGHYISRGASPALRFHPDNIHKQCEPCNTSKSGNQIEYRKRLLDKIGQKAVDWLEGPHELQHWRKEEYLEIEAEHKLLLKELQCKS